MPRRREVATPEWALELHVPELIEENPLVDIVRDCVEELDEDDQNALLSYFYERRTQEFLAYAYGLAGRTSGHYRIQRALDRLRELLAEKGITDATFTKGN